MTFGEALDVFEMTARTALIRRLRDGITIAMENEIEQGLAEARQATLPVIQALGGPEAVEAWKAAQTRNLG